MDKECELCIKRKTMFCPNSNECYETKEKPFYQNRIMLLKENQQLKAKITELGLELEDRAYEQLKQENQQIKKDAEFEKTYARSLRKIIYKLYMDIELSTGEFATLRQAIEENEVTND